VSKDTLLIITTSYPHSADGSEAAGAFVADIATEFAKTIPVRVVAPGLRAGEVEIAGNLMVRRFATEGKPLSLLSPARMSDWFAIARIMRSMQAEAFAANDDRRVAHTLAFWVLPSGWMAMAMFRQLGVPYSVWALGSDIWSLGRYPGIRSILRRVIGGARHRFADGLMLGDAAAKIGHVPFEFLPSTRSLDKLRDRPLAASPPFKLLFLGRWHPNKGIDLLLSALEMLDDESWSLISDVHIAGGGPLQDVVYQCVDKLQRAGRPVRRSGFLDRAQAADALNQADLLLLPSRIESIPVVFSDAMKMCLPVISMPVGDLPRLISEFGVGVVADSVQAGAFASAIARGLKLSPLGLRDAMAHCGEKFRVDIDELCARFQLPSNRPGRA